MKYSFFVIVLLISSCSKYLDLRDKKHNENKIKAVQVKEISNWFKNSNGDEIPNDTLVYENVQSWKNIEECSEIYSYAISNVEMLRLDENYANYRFYHYKSCKAIKYEDTIEITFNFSALGGGDVVYFENKPIKLIIQNNFYELSITHTSDVFLVGLREDGKSIPVPSPRSTVNSSRLILNKEHYEVGDTIKGEVYAKSEFIEKKYAYFWKRGERKRKELKPEKKREIVKGTFRVILEDKNNRCLKK